MARNKALVVGGLGLVGRADDRRRGKRRRDLVDDAAVGRRVGLRVGQRREIPFLCPVGHPERDARVFRQEPNLDRFVHRQVLAAPHERGELRSLVQNGHVIAAAQVFRRDGVS